MLGSATARQSAVNRNVGALDNDYQCESRMAANYRLALGSLDESLHMQRLAPNLSLNGMETAERFFS